MSEQPQSLGVAKTYRPSAAEWEQPVGNLRFAGVMLLLIGGFHAIDGLVALLRDEFFSARPEKLPIDISYSVWGWIHLVLGALMILAGWGLLSGRGGSGSRRLAVVLAALSALGNFLFLPAGPLSSIVMIGVDVAIIQSVSTTARYSEY